MLSPRRAILLIGVLGVLLGAWALHPGAIGASKDGSARGRKPQKKRSRNDTKKAVAPEAKGTNPLSGTADQTGAQSGAAGALQSGQNGSGGASANRTEARGKRAKGATAAANSPASSSGGRGSGGKAGDSRIGTLVEKVIAIQNRNHEAIASQKGVIGTATGLNDDGDVVIRVYTTGADGPTIPRTVENIPVVEVMTGPIYPAQLPPLRRQRLQRPVPIGVSAFSDTAVSATECFPGTLGVRLSDTAGRFYALSTNHCFAGENSLLIGTPAVQPAPGDVNCQTGVVVDRIGTLAAFVPVDTTGTVANLVDAAIIRTTQELVNAATLADGYGTPTSTPAPPLLATEVQKYGRTSGLTIGLIIGVNARITIPYGNGNALFIEQIEIQPGNSPSFGLPGDSGSLVVDMNRNPVGLLFANGANSSFANRIDQVIRLISDQLNANLGFGGGTGAGGGGTGGGGGGSGGGTANPGGNPVPGVPEPVKLHLNSLPPTLIGKEGRSEPDSP